MFTMNNKLGVIGLGKLGYCLAAILAQDNKVVGVDVIDKPRIPHEPYLDRLIRTGDLETTIDYSLLRGCKAIFCIVPTPSKKDGTFSDKYVRQAIDSAKPYMKSCKVFDVVSTVMPGTCDRLKKRLPKGTQIAYNPEFIAIGNIIEGMVHPDFVLIGEEDNSGDLLAKIYEGVTDAPIKRMDLTSAELTKIALNTYITQKITYANIIGEISDRIGADAEKVLDAVGTDKRIGNKYFKPTGAYGGPCFPRDTVAFSKMAGDIPNFANLTDRINKRVAKKKGYADDRPQYQNILGEGTGFKE